MLVNYILLATAFLTFNKASYVTICDPLTDTSCSASDKALTDSPTTIDFSSETTVEKYFDNYSDTGNLTYSSDGLEFTLAKRYDNPSLRSNFYLMFGRVEIMVKPATGTGIVSTIYLQSDDLDEIDLEWVGTETTTVQTNYFSKGNTTSYDRGEYNSLEDKGDLFNSVHNYTVDWTNEHVKWYIDGLLVRTLSNSSSEGFPQTPMAIYIGVWAGGDPSNSEGTIEWAGGETDYDDAPFSMLLQSMTVENYSTGSTYTYSNTDGTWESIDATDGEVLGSVVDYSDTSSSNVTSTSSSTSLTSSYVSSATQTSSESHASTTTLAPSSTTSSLTTTLAPSTTVNSSASASASDYDVEVDSYSSTSNSSTYSTTITSNSITSSSSASSTATIASTISSNAGNSLRAPGGLTYSSNNKIFFALVVSLMTLVII
ncbi:hypothetical protein QEN19_002784 [Hanseniaspora menglaensis]